METKYCSKTVSQPHAERISLFPGESTAAEVFPIIVFSSPKHNKIVEQTSNISENTRDETQLIWASKVYI